MLAVRNKSLAHLSQTWNIYKGVLKLEKVDLVITDTPAFRILNDAMKGMKHVVISLTTYSFHDHQKLTNSCN